MPINQLFKNMPDRSFVISLLNLYGITAEKHEISDPPPSAFYEFEATILKRSLSER